MLRADTGELTRAGRAQRLTQQPLRILLELLGNPGRIVSRERLVEVLWPKGVVDYDNGLNVAMRKLRVSLGDESDTPRYIETVPRLGYRFIGTLEPEPPAVGIVATPESPPIARRRYSWLFAGGIVGGAVLVVLWVMNATRPADPVADGSVASRETAVAAPIVARRTTSPRAYEAYLQGIFHRSRRDADATRQAIESFELALREDSEYAEAWAGLAETYIGAGIGHSIPAREAFTKAKAAALRSVKLDPGIAETHTVLGQVYALLDRDYAAAEAEYQRALAANEKYARLWHHLSMLRGFQGRADEALAAVRRARELEPMTLLFNANYALVLYHSRRYDEAIAHARELLKAQPQFHQAQSTLMRALVASGKAQEALPILSQRKYERPNLSDAALIYASLGRREDAMAEIARIQREFGQRGFGVGYELAIAHAALGDLAGGCRALELAWEDLSPFLGWMRLDPRMDPLRGQACYSEILARLGSK